MSSPPFAAGTLRSMDDFIAGTGEALAVRVADAELTYAQLRCAVAEVGRRIEGKRRLAVWATTDLSTVTGVLGALCAGVPAVLVNPKSGERELLHVLEDSKPDAILCSSASALPEAARRFAPTLEIETDCGSDEVDSGEGVAPEAPALIVYTSGTTGPPKGAVLPRRALLSNLDDLAQVWGWTADDTVVHALPLFHIHGLVLATLGPLRRGGATHHVGRFSAQAIASALRRGPSTMLFAVPTMYHRLVEDGVDDPDVHAGLAAARLLVSGSAALPGIEHQRLREAAGVEVLERYGMTETLINTSVAVGDPVHPGSVGRPLPSVEIRLLGDDGREIDEADQETIGELEVRGPNLFLGYLNRPETTQTAFHDGWFVSGDLAVHAAAGAIRLVGRRSTDIIKSGGFKIGAGEIEGALLEHRAVAEAAVTAEPDPDLGERIVAWIVLRDGESASARELVDHVAGQLAPHKRPRVVHHLAELPRNAMGKVVKSQLRAIGAPDGS